MRGAAARTGHGLRSRRNRPEHHPGGRPQPSARPPCPGPHRWSPGGCPGAGGAAAAGTGAAPERGGPASLGGGGALPGSPTPGRRRDRLGAGPGGGAGHRWGRASLRPHHQPRPGQRRWPGDGLAGGRRAAGPGVRAVSSHRTDASRCTPFPDLGSGARRRGPTARPPRPEPRGPSGWRRPGAAGSGEPCPGAPHAGAARGPRLAGPAAGGGGAPAAPVPDDRGPLPPAGARTHPGAPAGGPGGPLLDGGGGHRSAVRHLSARALCRGRSGLYRRARREPAGQQLPDGMPGVCASAGGDRAASPTAWPASCSGTAAAAATHSSARSPPAAGGDRPPARPLLAGGGGGAAGPQPGAGPGPAAAAAPVAGGTGSLAPGR